MDASRLSHEQRTRDLIRLGDTPFDVLVIGGGVVGAGAALDAATRGLTVALIEARDWAAGTSSRSTKLIHGGLRYLRMLDFGLVREALRERGLLLERLAPHLVRKVRFLYPLRHRIIERAYTALGIALYDALATSSRNGRGVPRQRQESRSRLYRENPGLARGRFIGGIEYFDAQVDDARFVMSLVRTAAFHGAVALSRVAATGLIRENGSVVGARLRDQESGAVFDVRACSVVLATGVWSTIDDDGSPERPGIQPSKGVHLILAKEKIALSGAMVIETEKSVLFVIPWREHWIVGTTDTAWHGNLARPVATDADIAYLLGHLNAILERPIGPEDVDAVYAGIRPLVSAPSDDPSTISREHAVNAAMRGLVTVSGGKFTTYRVMAEDSIDAVLGDEARRLPSITTTVPLVGARTQAELVEYGKAVVDATGLAPGVVERLIGRYGSLVGEVLDPDGDDPGLLEELPGGSGYLVAEARYAVTHEGALHLEDVLHRRLRLDIESSDGGLESAPTVAAIMAAVLGWSDDHRATELAKLAALIAAEAIARTLGDDRAAGAAMDALSPWDAIPPIS